ncbi:SRPBCC domain-containing protein [Streptomyces sp. SBT349]|uniref:SRPBCC domain-containing protein n=1 Tax=Streptomyces sp. SBT349 TaxID=1580539 RepID=UPI00066CC440|nr:SRPBCC domain-containing protein [Streptomyces sp. SBT349]
MEHEVFLPYAPSTVRSALGRPERVARCVPGLQLDPEGDPLAPAGRLRLRIGSSTITYRGGLTVTGGGESFTVEAQGHEARGSGTATLLLTVAPREAEDGTGTVLAFTGTVEAKGRMEDVEAEQREAAGRRLLDRFAEALADELADEERQPPAVGGGIGEPDDNERAIPGIPPPDSVREVPPPDAIREVPPVEPEPSAEAEPEPELPDIDIPPPTLDPAVEEDESGLLPEPEADFARRTMIGRSAEEVDHAPPRGRYAPEPAPGRSSGAATLRWAAPAAAMAVATAVLITRALRRRR